MDEVKVPKSLLITGAVVGAVFGVFEFFRIAKKRDYFKTESETVTTLPKDYIPTQKELDELHEAWENGDLHFCDESITYDEENGIYLCDECGREGDDMVFIDTYFDNMQENTTMGADMTSPVGKHAFQPARCQLCFKHKPLYQDVKKMHYGHGDWSYYLFCKKCISHRNYRAEGSGEIERDGGRMVSIEETTIVNYSWHTDPDEVDVDDWDIQLQVEEKVQDEYYADDSGSGSFVYDITDEGVNVYVYYEWDKTTQDGDEEYIKGW